MPPENKEDSLYSWAGTTRDWQGVAEIDLLGVIREVEALNCCPLIFAPCFFSTKSIVNYRTQTPKDYKHKVHFLAYNFDALD